MTKTPCYTVLSCLLALGACVDTPPSAYQIRSPESMLSPTIDLETLDLTSPSVIERLTDMLTHNPPNHAVLNCSQADEACRKVTQLLITHKIPNETTGTGYSVTLMYNRIATRDCDPRYVDNSLNQRNLNYEAFGCSIAGNTVQMVTDKRQFTNPDLLEYRDGEKTSAVYDNYLNPPASSSGGQQGGVNSLIPGGSGGGQ